MFYINYFLYISNKYNYVNIILIIIKFIFFKLNNKFIENININDCNN